VGGGFNEESRIGGSTICVGIGQKDLRFGDDGWGTMISSTEEFV
jgi:hypothetical protein